MAIEIPEELVIEILSRLPPESLLRFRCVSKLWRSLISNPKFTLSSPSQRHLYIANHPNYSEFFYSFDDDHTSSTGPIPVGRMLRNVNNKEMNEKGMWHHVQILGSCNGLLLVSYYADLYLWNPTIMLCTKVLSLEVGSIFGHHFMNVSGLCYDSYSDDYKAVSVDKYGSVTVISFRRKKWDKTICSPLKVDGDHREFLDRGPVVIVNEKLHWLIIGCFPTPGRIVYFDPLTDEFGGFPMPEAPNNRQHDTHRIGLGVLEGCLCMAFYVWEEHVFTLEDELDEVQPIFIEVWVMKEHGVVESWTRAFIISYEVGIFPWRSYKALVPFCFTKDGGVLVSVDTYQFLVYNPNEMSKRGVPLIRNQNCSYMASYVESVASPATYGHEEDWVVQGPDAWSIFFCSSTDFEDSSIEEGDISFGSDSDGESFRSPKEDSSIEEEDTSYGYCSDKESFHSTKGDSSTEEEDACSKMLEAAIRLSFMENARVEVLVNKIHHQRLASLCKEILLDLPHSLLLPALFMPGRVERVLPEICKAAELYGEVFLIKSRNKGNREQTGNYRGKTSYKTKFQR